jgi:hypothetical protein
MRTRSYGDSVSGVLSTHVTDDLLDFNSYDWIINKKFWEELLTSDSLKRLQYTSQGYKTQTVCYRCSCRWGEIVSEQRPRMDLLFMIYECEKSRWNDIDRAKPNN